MKQIFLKRSIHLAGILLGILLLTNPWRMQAQGKMDSLAALLQAHPVHDTARTEILYQLCREYVNGSNLLLQHYAQQLIENAKEINSPLMEFRGLTALGVSYSREGVLVNKSLEIYQQAFDILKHHHGQDWTKREAQLYLNIAFVHIDQNEYQKALSYQKKAEAIFIQTRDTVLLADNYRSIAVTYDRMAENDSLIWYLNRALSLYQRCRHAEGIAACYDRLCHAYLTKSDYRTAQSYLEKSFKLVDSAQMPARYIDLIIAQGLVFKKMRMWDKAEKSFLYCLYKSRLLHLNEEDVLLELAKVCQDANRPARALAYFQEYSKLRDEHYASEKSRQINELEAVFQVAAKERENETLRKEKDLASLAKGYYQLAVIFLLMLLLLSGVFFYRLHLQRNLIAHQSKELAQLNQSLNKHNELMQKTLRDKKFLVNLLAHDIRTPLMHIQLGLVELQGKIPANATIEKKKILSDMLQSSTQINEMVRKIIEVEEVENEVRQASKEQVDLNRICQDVQHDLEGLASQVRLSLTVLPENDLPPIAADPYLTKRVVGNLVSNAIKYADTGTSVLMYGEVTPNRLLLHVENQGPGIGEGMNKFLNQKQNVGQSSVGKYDVSMGMGLYLAKQYIDALGGEILTNYNEATRQMIFTISLPAPMDALQPLNAGQNT